MRTAFLTLLAALLGVLFFGRRLPPLAQNEQAELHEKLVDPNL